VTHLKRARHHAQRLGRYRVAGLLIMYTHKYIQNMILGVSAACSVRHHLPLPAVQGYLAHAKLPTPLGPWIDPTEGSWEVFLMNEVTLYRGTSFNERVSPVQGYLVHTKRF
jgi:hypothetical protein